LLQRTTVVLTEKARLGIDSRCLCWKGVAEDLERTLALIEEIDDEEAPLEAAE
jgi:hypothetical protein